MGAPSTEGAPIVEARGVKLAYGPSVVVDVDEFSANPSEVICIVGRSGSGKTSFLHCLSGLTRPNSGHVTLVGHPLETMSDQDRALVRGRHAGFVFQSADLVPELTLAENIELPLRLAGASREDRRERISNLLERLGLVEAGSRRPHEVSGGQAQRAAIGRAVANKPTVVFADEPTGALDSSNRASALTLLHQLARQEGTALIIVTHDQAVADSADRVLTMTDGRFVG